MDRQAWFCPACQKHHAPHCDTCPEVAGAQPGPAPVMPGPSIQTWPPQDIYIGDPVSAPWVPYWPATSSAVGPNGPYTLMVN